MKNIKIWSRFLVIAFITSTTALWIVTAQASITHIHHFEIFQDRLILGTHEGLFSFRVNGEHQRIGKSSFDVMGLAVNGKTIYTSGHPGVGDSRPALLGLLKSTDGGKNWQQVSLLGKADFHLLEAAGDHIVGGDSASGRLFYSEDAGSSWKQRGVNHYQAIALSPIGDSKAFGISEGRLFSTTDGFVSRQSLRTMEAISDIAWSTGGLFIAQGNQLLISTNAGEDWNVRSQFKGKIDAVRAIHKNVYVTSGSVIYRSRDAGKTFKLIN